MFANSTMHVLLADHLNPILTFAQAGAGAKGANGATEAAGFSLWQQIQNGGITGYIILALSVVAFALIVIHLISIRLSRFLPENVRIELTNALAGRDLERALDVCREPANDCFLTRVVVRGIMRYRRSAFGPFEFKDALEEAGGEQVARLYRSTDALGLIGAIAPMLGLLGTVIGMVGAFETIAAADSRGELLAGDISKALVTTLMGLSLAIPCMAAFTYFRNRIDTYAALAAHEIEEMTLPLEPASAPPDAQARPQQPLRSPAQRPPIARPGNQPRTESAQSPQPPPPLPSQTPSRTPAPTRPSQ